MDKNKSRLAELIELWLAIAISVYLCSLFWGYIKDDAFIGFRYARNLAEGNGLTFNPGEQVEGYTNFLWVLIMAAGIKLGLDPVYFSRFLAILYTIAIFFTLSFINKLCWPRATGLRNISLLLLASSTSLALWTVSGLEITLFALLILQSVFWVLRILKNHANQLVALVGGCIISLATLTRPEGHIYFAVLWFFLAVHWLKSPTPHSFGDQGRCLSLRRLAFFTLPFLIIVGIYHLWRLSYFGYLFPNTYYVKGAVGIHYPLVGLGYIWSLLKFNFNWLFLVLALVALLQKENRAIYVLIWALISSVFLYYMKIGQDTMIFYRHFLPVLGLVMLLTVEGVRALDTKLKSLLKTRRLKSTVPVILYLILAVAALLNFHHSIQTSSKYNRYYQHALQSQGELARYLQTHSRPGDLALHQDMGIVPYIARDVKFIDSIGIVDSQVAQLLYKYGINPFIGQSKKPAKLMEFKREVLAYFFSRQPRWVIIVAYVKPYEKRVKVLEELKDQPRLELFEEYLTMSPHYYGLYGDQRFKQNYHFLTCYQRSATYYLFLFARAD